MEPNIERVEKMNSVFDKMENQKYFVSLKTQAKDSTTIELVEALFPEGLNRQISSDDIERTEKKLKITLPFDYKEFLRLYGFAMWDGNIITGISQSDNSKDELDYSVVMLTNQVRKRADEFLKSHLLTGCIVSSDDTGGYYILNSMDSATPGRVHYLIKNKQWTESESWDSFIEFLSSLM